MKDYFYAMFFLCGSVGSVALGQGTFLFEQGSSAGAGTLQAQPAGILFNNRVIPQVDAPIFHTDCQTPLSGLEFQAGLYAGAEGALASELVQVGPPSYFRTEPFAGYFISGGIVPIPFLNPAENGTFQVRVWETAAGSFEAAQAGAGLYGQSELLTIFLRASPRGPDADLAGLESFCLVPEPSPLWLWAGGGLVLAGCSAWLRRRSRIASPDS